LVAGSKPQLFSFTYWLRFYRHRVLRLWPAYLYVLLVIIYRFSRSHIHPMWAPNDQGAMCRQNWWKNVLFINSLTDNLCMPWTWYIGTEFILFLLTPIFLLAFKRSCALGLLLSVICICASSALHIIESIEYNFPPTQMLWVQPAIFNQDFMQHHLLLYIKPQYRIGPYIIGLIAGYLISSYKLDGSVKNTTKFISIGWMVASIFAISSLFGLYPALQGWDWPVYHLIYGATHRILWALAIAWLIYACHNGYGGPLNNLLSLRIFSALAAASYSTYLVHLVLVMASFMKAPFPIVYNGPMTLVRFCAMQIPSAYFIGAITMFIVELPANNIERILLQRPTVSKRINRSDIKQKLVEN
uniref:Acyl_transf_3 domain-containing protein n=1 Tax=Toxocara canis TaxID=6265 RepID=A0A183V6L1_TOXCA